MDQLGEGSGPPLGFYQTIMTDLITLDEYKLAKGLSKTDKDDQLDHYISVASSLIQTYLGYDYFDTGNEITETFNLDYDTNVIFLEKYPVKNVISLTTLDPYYHDSTVHFPAPVNAYRVDLRDGKLIRTAGFWPQGYGSVTISYTAGNDSSSQATVVPVDLKQATIDLVTYYVKEEYVDSKSLRGATINNAGSGNTSASARNTTAFPPHIQRVLDLYKYGAGRSI